MTERYIEEHGQDFLLEECRIKAESQKYARNEATPGHALLKAFRQYRMWNVSHISVPQFQSDASQRVKKIGVNPEIREILSLGQ